MKRMHPFFYFFVISLFFNSCKLYDNIPRAEIGGFPEVTSVNVNPQSAALKLEFIMPVKFHNPFKQDILIPEHQFTVKVNQEEVPLQMQEVMGFTVPAKSDFIHPYPFSLDLAPNGPLKEMLGKDNELEFEIKLKLDLDELGINLSALGGNKIPKKIPIEFSFSDSIRIPKLPRIEPSGEMANVRFTGQMETFDLTGIKNGLTPMMNLITETEFNNGYISEAAELALNATITVPNPSVSNPFATKEINFTDYVAGLFGEDMTENWNSVKAQLNPGDKNVMQYTVDNFLNPLSANMADDMYENFLEQWNNFEDQDLKFTFPGPRVTGIIITMPVKIMNENQFPIHIPYYNGSASLNNQTPLEVSVESRDNSEILNGLESRELDIKLTLNWQQGGQGILNMINGNNMNTVFSGEMKVDLGYGPVPMNYSIPVGIQWGD